jgi:four helix bundle protein
MNTTSIILSKIRSISTGKKFKIDIKLMSQGFPKEERFDLISQINRHQRYVSANLAEGSGRSSNFEGPFY